VRGGDTQQGHMWSYIQPEQRVPQDHPLRPIRAMVDQALKDLSPRFALLYSHTGRPSIPPEQLLRALLLQAFYSVRSERQLMEQLDYNLLFRWFVGLSMDDPIWDPTVFTKNRDRLFQGDIAQAFFAAVLAQARQANLVSAEHFTVDGTLLEAWASQKSFQPKAQPTPPPDPDPGNPTVDFRGEQRRNATHQSKTDPDAQLIRKSRGQAAILGYRGHVLMENRHGLVVGAQATQVIGGARHRADARHGDPRGAPRHARRRQGVRHGGLRHGLPRADAHPPCRAEHHRHPRECHRRPHDPASRLRHQPTVPQMRRGGLRVVEDHRPTPEAPPPGYRLGELDLPPPDDGLQPHPDAESPGGDRMTGRPGYPVALDLGDGRGAQHRAAPHETSSMTRITCSGEPLAAFGARFSAAC
jgi:transposase